MNSVLIVSCSIKEVYGLISKFNFIKDNTFRIEDCIHDSIGLYYSIFPKIFLAITGVLEHNAVAILAKIFLHYPDKFLAVINYGCCGRYDSPVTNIGGSYYVSSVERYGIDDNRHWAAPITLVCPTTAHVVCASGSKYSTQQDR